MRILFLISCLSYGGAEKNMRIVAEHLNIKGHKIAVASLGLASSCLTFSPEIQVFELKGCEYKGRIVRPIWSAYKDLKPIIKEFAPEVLISFLNISNLLCVLLGKRFNIPSIISERGDPYVKGNWKRNIIKKIYDFIYSLSDGAVFQTRMACEYYANRLQKRSTIICNPVLLPSDSIMHDHTSCKKKIVCVGRYEIKQKRQDYMLKAFKIVLKRHPDYTLYLYGDGPDAEVIKEAISLNGLSANVVCELASNGVLNAIYDAEMLVSTSDYEGIPNVIMEAMSIGLPCISTDCSPGGARMLITHKKDGIIVSRGDVEAIAQAMCYYIENRQEAAMYGEKAIKIRQKYSLDTIMSQWDDYITHIYNSYHS